MTDITRAVDQAIQGLHDEHADDLTFVPEWGPLELALPESELGGWMFMNRNATEHGEIISYKHGITRKYLHLGKDGSAWMTRWSPDGKAAGWIGPVSVPVRLSGLGHYADLEASGAEPGTAYDDEYKAGRNRALRDAGFEVIEGRI